ncbi:DUF1592 domain-containing protein [Alienimonas californiensis]|uniref:Planctomycete cytochrome C n=1 Tax=Alienimonas californiensis TaxID=2527989 RepID=A0A517PAB9_9PLAN|nr:DUF1592 domain-containing protein [Alienimonas californiensis]QDT16312.1 Planctomycete cytochrome C [Alienimonas californiensis]
MLDACRPFVVAALWCGVVAGGLRAADGAPATTGEERRFLAEVAPVLAKRCLECHGPTSRKGGFDLSHRDRLAAGGVNGAAVVAGKADDSPLWQYVDSDTMPPDGPPLSKAEKAVLKKWLDAGAPWPKAEPWAVLHAAGGEAAGAGWVRRLTAPEYLASVRAVTGVDLAADAARLLPADLRADGFHNTAYNLAVDLEHVRAYAELARLAVARADLPALLKQHAPGKTPRERIEALGALALRGPLSEDETAPFLAVADAMRKEGGTEEEALGLVLEAMLQSPRFLYRIETQRGDGTTRPVTGHELANRLSYTLWGAPPDAALRAAAERGELTADPAGRAALQKQIARLLDDPRARDRSARFAHEWLNLDRLDALSPAAERFPNWNPALAGDMRRETRAFFNHVAWSERPLTALLTDRTAFLTPRLAAHYGQDWGALAENAVLLAPPEPAGVVAVYDFAGDGNIVRDLSGQDGFGTGEPLDLEIGKGAKVRRTPAGLRIDGPSQISAPRPAKRLTAALKKSGEVTIEVWLTPADAKQAGPARIVTLSGGSSKRNVTLAQEGKKYDARLRTTSNADNNGLPSTSTDDAVRTDRPTHVVFTRRSTGLARLWVDGAMRGNRSTEGSFGNWDDGFRLALAGEIGDDRPWRGTLHRVAIYDRALSDEEIAERAGAPWRVDLPEDAPRRGLLTQGTTLTVGGDEASTVSRGLFVLRDLLLGSIGDPPPGVDTTPVPAGPGLSQRQMAEKRLADASCAGCHVQFEPFAFAFERYDGLGGFRTKDHHGNALRTDGAVKLPGGEQATFATTAEFLDLIAAGEPVRRGLTRKLTQFALGRPLTPADEPAVQAIHDAAWSADAPHGPGSYRAVMAAIAGSELTLTAPTEPASLSSASPNAAPR